MKRNNNMNTIIIRNFDTYRIKRKRKGEPFIEAIFEGKEMKVEKIKKYKLGDVEIKTNG